MEPGDSIYIVALKSGILSVVSSMVVGKIISVRAFLRDHLQVPEVDLELHLWNLEEKLLRERPELGHALPFGCVDEAAVPQEATTIRLDRHVPAEVLASLTFRNARGHERVLPTEDGFLRKSTGIQGHFLRLIPESAAALGGLVRAGSAS